MITVFSCRCKPYRPDAGLKAHKGPINTTIGLPYSLRITFNRNKAGMKALLVTIAENTKAQARDL